MFRKNFLALLCPLLFFNLSASASAISAIEESRSDSAALLQGRINIENERQRQLDIISLKSALANMKQHFSASLQLKEDNISSLKRTETAIETTLQKIATELEQRQLLSKALSEAENLERQMTAELLAAQQNLERAEAAARRADVSLKTIETASAPANEIVTLEGINLDNLLLKADETNKRLETAAKEASAAWNRAEIIAAKNEELAAKVETLTQKKEETADALAETESRLLEAQAELTELQNEKTEFQAAQPEIEKEINDTQIEIENVGSDLNQLLNPPPDNNVYYSSAARYYSIKSSNGQTAYQFVNNHSFFHSCHGIDYGLNINYINNKGSNGSHISTLGDTVISFAHTNKNLAYPIRYSLDISLPTGSASLSPEEKASLPDEDLGEFSSLGNGWKITPGISVSRPIGKEDTWTLGANLQFQGDYQPLQNDPASLTMPGRQTAVFLSWQHLGALNQTKLELNRTSSDITKQNNLDYYSEGTKWDFKVTHNRILSKKDSLLLYGRLSYHQPERYAANIIPPDSNTGLHSSYLGFLLKHSLSATQTIRFSTDYLKRNGSIATLNSPTVIGDRNRVSYGIGFDHAFSPDKTISLDLQRFFLHNSGNSPDYSGFIAQIKFSSHF